MHESMRRRRSTLARVGVGGTERDPRVPSLTRAHKAEHDNRVSEVPEILIDAPAVTPLRETKDLEVKEAKVDEEAGPEPKQVQDGWKTGDGRFEELIEAVELLDELEDDRHEEELLKLDNARAPLNAEQNWDRRPKGARNDDEVKEVPDSRNSRRSSAFYNISSPDQEHLTSRSGGSCAIQGRLYGTRMRVSSF